MVVEDDSFGVRVAVGQDPVLAVAGEEGVLPLSGGTVVVEAVCEVTVLPGTSSSG